MKYKHFLSLLFCILLIGCGSNGLASVPKVEIEIINQSSHDLENTQARFGEFVCAWGRLVKTATASYMSYPHPITAQTELHWEVEGKPRAEKLDLRKIYSPGKSGRLTFTIYDGRVDVSFRSQ